MISCLTVTRETRFRSLQLAVGDFARQTWGEREHDADDESQNPHVLLDLPLEARPAHLHDHSAAVA